MTWQIVNVHKAEDIAVIAERHTTMRIALGMGSQKQQHAPIAGQNENYKLFAAVWASGVADAMKIG